MWHIHFVEDWLSCARKGTMLPSMISYGSVVAVKASVIPTQAGKEAEWTFKWIIGSHSKQIFFHFSVARECCCFCWLCSLAREQSSFPDCWYLLEGEICLEMFPVLEMQPEGDEPTSCWHPEENCGLTVSLGYKCITALYQEFVLPGHVYRAEHHKAS